MTNDNKPTTLSEPVGPDTNSSTETKEVKDQLSQLIERSPWKPLMEYLLGLPETDQVCLSFDDLERILGWKLPASARKKSNYWANTFSNERALFWTLAGRKARLEADHVCFVADRYVLKRIASRGHWQKVSVFFRELPAFEEQVYLTFDEFSSIRGSSLPVSARQDRTWWGNTQNSPHAKSWLDNGWEVDSVYLRAELVVFRRRDSTKPGEIRRYVRHLLGESSDRHGRPDTGTLVTWIVACKRWGWYFETTVLFEKGLRTDALTEVERVQLEEVYSECKRSLNRFRRGGIVGGR